MTTERWRQVEQLYHGALTRDADHRAAFLAEACAGDEALRFEVQSLLDQSPSSLDTFLESPALDVAAPRIDAPEPLLTGRRLAEYELQSRLGAGGMGEVYRARDVTLGRDVAIKVLPAPFAHDLDRVARFRREARLLAALNHPHIGAIYAFAESEGLAGLVLELVEGPTLADRLVGGALPMNEVLSIAHQTADALEAAHVKGIIHRDLKPANIKVTPDGTVKVLDFGIAKAVVLGKPELSQAPTMTVSGTRDGMILGTAPYMSPEQARGQDVDKRTDIWAFGCVMYEMLTGRRAFHGETIADCLATILQREPEWKALPASTPPRVVGLLRRCLEKDAQRRLSDIGEARRELEEMRADLSGRIVRGQSLTTVAGRARTAARGGTAVGLLIAATLSLYAVRQMAPKVEQLDISLSAQESIPPTHSSELALSPNGRLIAYASSKAMAEGPMMASTQSPGADPTLAAAIGNMGMQAMPMMTKQIYVRSLDQQQAKPIGGALGDAPFFSPDGKWLGFWHAPTGTLRKVGLTGGAPVKICDAVSGIAGAAWGPDDTIVFAWFDLFRVSAAGGSPQLLLKVDDQRGERFYRHPSFLPGGKAILFTIGKADTDSYDDADIGVLSLETGEKKILIQGGSSARYSPSGHVIYARAGKLLAVSFDAKALQVTGQPFPVVDGVFMSATTGMAAFSISDNGSLVYAAGPVESGARVPVWVDRKGQATHLTLPPRSYLHPQLSPDERQLAIEVEGASHDLYTYDFTRGILTKVTFDGASHWPIWTPKGDRLTFRSWKTGTMTMWSMPADRSGPAERLTSIGSMQSPESWSPDGRALLFTQMDDPESGADIYVLPLDGDRKPHPLIQTKFSEGAPKFSPDGKWLAYSSNESGKPEVYAMAYPGPGPKIQISTAGGTDPTWRRAGGELYYRNGDLMMVVTVTEGRTLTLSTPSVLWTGHYLEGVGSSCGMAGPTSSNYDVTTNGERFLMIEDKSQDVACKLLHVISNWSDELTRRKEN